MEKEQQRTDKQSGKQPEKKIDPTSLAVPEILPVLPLNGFVFFPGMGFPLQVADDSSKQLIDAALLGERMIGLVTTRKPMAEGMGHFSKDDLCRVGVIGYIHKLSKEKEGYYHVMVSGTKRIEIVKIMETTPYHRATVRELPMVWNESPQGQAMILSSSNPVRQTCAVDGAAERAGRHPQRLGQSFSHQLSGDQSVEPEG